MVLGLVLITKEHKEETMEGNRAEIEHSGTEAREAARPRGNGLKEFQIHKILIDLHNNNKTGTLTVKTPVFINVHRVRVWVIR